MVSHGLLNKQINLMTSLTPIFGKIGQKLIKKKLIEQWGKMPFTIEGPYISDLYRGWWL